MATFFRYKIINNHRSPPIRASFQSPVCSKVLIHQDYLPLKAWDHSGSSRSHRIGADNDLTVSSKPTPIPPRGQPWNLQVLQRILATAKDFYMSAPNSAAAPMYRTPPLRLTKRLAASYARDFDRR